MRAQRDIATAATVHAKHIADFIDVHISKSNVPEAIRKPRPAWRLAKRRRRNPRRLPLPGGDLRGLSPEMIECSPNLRQARKPGHFLRHRRIVRSRPLPTELHLALI